MSQYPPPFDGHHNYAPQWPMQLASSSSVPGQSNTNFFPINNNQMGIGGFSSSPFGTNAPGQLPGLGMPNVGSIPPSFFPQQATNNQVPIPLHHGFNSFGSFPMESSHPAPPTTFAYPSGTVESARNQPDTRHLKISSPLRNDDTDREEGEVSDGPALGLPYEQYQSQSGSNASSQVRATDATGTAMATAQPRAPTATPTPRSGSASQESNTSSYTPPMAIATNGASHKMASSPDSIQVRKAENQASRVPQFSGKSPAQIRIMAQGALLRLAPHKIRFDELVKEDINPAILKKLYDEIGIKVEIKAPESSIVAIDTSGQKSTNSTNAQRLEAQDKSVSETKTMSMPTSKATEVSVMVSDKPLERKDVIARMLAAKAKKKPATSVVIDSTCNTPTSKHAVEAQNAAKNKDESSSLPTPQVSQIKEKNKAQTELARQRIEQLKKMGLKRQPTNPETLAPSRTSSSTENTMMTPNANTETTITLHHPLPERPPVASEILSSTKALTPQIPGLSLSSESEKNDSPLSIDSRGVGTPTPFRNSLGKRPRASDFDEPIPETNKSSVAESRLVIDISEDESLDMEEDVVMSEASEHGADSQMSKANGTMNRELVSRNTSSASATPQSKTGDSESLRVKNLEIQAMYRRIAEWEEKKAQKAKSTPPPSALTGNAPQRLGQIEDIPCTSIKTSVLSDKSSPQAFQRSPSVNSLASLDANDLDRIRQKLLRKREIESGLPALDAELLSYENKLAQFKRDEEKLLNIIAKNRAERKLLSDELENLGIETEGLTIEELKAVKEDIARAAVVQDEHESDEVVPAESVSLTTKDPQAVVTAAVPTQPVEHVSSSLESKSSLLESHISEDSEMNDAADVDDSSSDSSGSSMDESTSSSGSSSADVESILEHQSAPLPEITSLDNEVPGEALENGIALPGKGDLTARASDSTPVGGLHASRESSVLSDVYEPPEPEQSPDEAYSPKLSPSGAGDSDLEMTLNLPNKNDADVTLIRNPQESVVIAYKGDALDNKPNINKAISKFSPYQSPLKRFRAYRYHPNFLEDVGDSYRSLTYSHKINPSQAVCPYEAAGGVCNDTTCEFQHWREMVMPDDKILVEMGNQKEGKTPEEQDAYIKGLKELINNMRRDQVKDFSTVAGEIAAYRRRFLSDPSRILPL